MTDFWHTFQDKFSNDTSLNVADDSSFFMGLPQLSIIEVSGEDAAGFLQNLLTNDVNQLNDNQAQLSGFCNPKGRLLALFWLVRTQHDRFFAILPNSVADILLKRLSMFVLRSKVVINDVSEQYVAFGLFPQTSHDLKTVKLSAHFAAELMIVEQVEAEQFTSEQLNKNWQLCPAEWWDRLNIKAGIPTVFAETSEAFTPQQINLDLIDGVSFKKGCYPGQEVVARLHYLGKPSRRLFSADYSGETLAANHIVTDSDDNTVGHIVWAAPAQPTRVLMSLKLSELNKDLSVNSNALSNVKALDTSAID